MTQKQVCQLDAESYFVGPTFADESPLEPGVYLLPAGAVDAPAPVIPEGHKAKWTGDWVFEPTPEPEPESESEPEPEPVVLTYAEKRAAEYPPVSEYLDGVVKGDQAQIDAYVAACLAVKAKYPKE
jgi:hypothetical protein